MAKLNFGVIVFPGINCDQDTYWVVDKVINQNVKYIWHTESNLDDIDVVIIPGGFSYGDYLRSGAIARISPVLRSITAHAEKGKTVLGICNGFQVLTEAGLVKGAFLRNKGVHFLCRKQHLKVTTTESPFTNRYKKGEVIQVPIAHGEGNYFLSRDDLKYTLDNNLVSFQYCDGNGHIGDETNPNGSIHSIAGVFNKAGNVMGMMPHPERSSEMEMGSVDGRKVFESITEWLNR
jgi:phosphoribosylformylglycinamidine synthase subunit PurQ / glutaminase